MTVFSENLSRIRRAAGMSQEQLAEELHVTRQTVSAWERGKREPDLETLNRLTEILSVEIGELLSGTKREVYPRFQRLYLKLSLITGGVALLILLFQFAVYPLIRQIAVSEYKLTLFYGIYSFAVPQLGYFAAGVFLPALLSLYYDTRLSNRLRLPLLLIGVLLALPAFALAVEMLLLLIFRELPLSVMQLLLHLFQFDSGRVLLLKIMPFLSGLLLFLGCNQKR